MAFTPRMVSPSFPAARRTLNKPCHFVLLRHEAMHGRRQRMRKPAFPKCRNVFRFICCFNHRFRRLSIFRFWPCRVFLFHRSNKAHNFPTVNTMVPDFSMATRLPSAPCQWCCAATTAVNNEQTTTLNNRKQHNDTAVGAAWMMLNVADNVVTKRANPLSALRMRRTASFCTPAPFWRKWVKRRFLRWGYRHDR